MTAPIVSVQNLSHRYAKAWAIRDIAFELDKPGIVGLLGSNGAGKSTIMNIMCGVLYPTEGDVEIKGYSIRKQSLQAKREIGFLPQQVPVYPEFTVGEYLRYAAALRRVPDNEIAEAVDQAMVRVDATSFSKRLIGSLSGGMRQRVGIAQAILHDPSLVVMDEPTTGLDPNQVLGVRRLIKEIAEERTVLLSTHILPDVESLCDEIKMIEAGRIVFEGAMEDFANVVRPRSVIARFAAAPSLDDLLAIQGVDGADATGAQRFRLHLDDPDHGAEAIVAASAEHKWGLKELTPERSSLEDVFAELSASGTGG